MSAAESGGGMVLKRDLQSPEQKLAQACANYTFAQFEQAGLIPGTVEVAVYTFKNEVTKACANTKLGPK